MDDEKIIEGVKLALQGIGENPTREGLLKTPSRVAKAYHELMAGYAQDPRKILATDFDSDGYDQMVALREVEFWSMCEHHMLPFHGTATVAYIPQKRVVGLSKLARLVDCFARRLQIQERMTQEIANAMMEHLRPRGVGVVVKAKHLCMTARGINKQNSEMVTSAVLGQMMVDSKARDEFLRLAGH
jgi:GTP cyclohydrolase I